MSSYKKNRDQQLLLEEREPDMDEFEAKKAQEEEEIEESGSDKGAKEHLKLEKSMTDAELEEKGYNLQQAYTKIGGFGKLRFLRKFLLYNFPHLDF